ncbi:MAG: HAD-IA family hydrolase [Acetobacteraceae bacterium]|nr:HAD-IA family hydrolase [Acetobacteraceae bacterium]
MTPETLRLVIFDCDGVLVDSEPVSNRVVAAECTALGWPMTTAEATAQFVGLRLSDMPPIIEARLGRRPSQEGWPARWVEHLRGRIIAALAREAEPMPGAAAVLRGVAALGLPYRVASNSSHEEMDVKFARTGLAALVEGRVHSARDVAAGKPAPDLFLAAAAAEGVAPGACLVVEDSVPGVRGARAAGMTCLGLAAHGDGAAALAAEGAVPIRSLAEVLHAAERATGRAAA